MSSSDLTGREPARYTGWVWVWRWLRGLDTKPAAPPVEPATPKDDPTVFPAAEILLTAALDDRQMRIGTLDALQAKVGIMLGLASALVVLAATWDTTAQRMCSAAPAALAAGVCLLNLWTRTIHTIEMRPLRDRYVGCDPTQTAIALVDTIIAHDDKLRAALRLASRTVRFAVTLLFVATIINLVVLTQLPPTVTPTTP